MRNLKTTLIETFFIIKYILLKKSRSDHKMWSCNRYKLEVMNRFYDAKVILRNPMVMYSKGKISKSLI